jgi:Papain-like cysteine protease AvrRpt2
VEVSILNGKVLPVPYFTQPTAITCQSTCLKMMAVYLERSVLLQSTGAEFVDIGQIWKEVNSGAGRPSLMRNAHVNFKWWLERRFPHLRFDYLQTTSEADAAARIVQAIDRDMPVLMSVSHAQVPGHIVLVVGYEGYAANMSSSTFNVVVHDPYGRFDPTLLSNLHGKERFTGGSSLQSGSESGPGQGCKLPITSVSRRRAGDAVSGTYFLLIPRR